MTIMEILDFVQITSPDGRLRSFWDQDVAVARIQLTDAPVQHERLVNDKGKILEYDCDERLTSVQLLC